MDSLKIPKTGGATGSGSSGNSPNNSVKGSVPIAVRFNAGEECIDDIFQSFHNNKNRGSNTGNIGGGAVNSGNSGIAGGGGGGGDSLSSSPSQPHQSHPQQNADEVNSRNNFLQSNFFNRKRSGSIEGISPTSSGPNLIAALSSGDATSVGTWKLIKGKVSQTIDDIKSSKSGSQVLPTVLNKSEQLQQQQQQQQQPQHHHHHHQHLHHQQHQQHDADSDQENATLNTPSFSEELPLDIDHFKHNIDPSVILPHDSKDNSDSELDPEILFEGEVEHSRLRRGLANLKSKVKSKSSGSSPYHTASNQQTTTNISSSSGQKMSEKDPSPSRNTTSLRSNFLRKRRKPVETSDLVAQMAVSEVNIPVAEIKNEKKRGVIIGKKLSDIESGVEMLEDMVPPVATEAEPSPMHKDKLVKRKKSMELPIESLESRLKAGKDENSMPTDSKVPSNTTPSVKDLTPHEHVSLIKRIIQYLPLITLCCLLLVLVSPLHDFVRGILACLFTILFIDSLSPYLASIIELFLVKYPPEKTEFQIPDYSKMDVCEIPPVEEHKTVKIYEGWMNEVNSYDPNNFHISMSKSVYVRLEGTIMRISTTTARIPKKVLWNEPPIDVGTLPFTDHRIFNLLGCRVELLPLGLARKRYFNRKYPLQLIIKSSMSKAAFERVIINSDQVATNEESLEIDATDSKESKVLTAKPGKTSINQSSSSEAQNERNSDVFFDLESSELDFSSTILNADLQLLQDQVNPDFEIKEFTVPCGDEVRLILFSRGDREKEDWYRRFVAASTGDIFDQNLRLPNMKFVTATDLQEAACRAAQLLTGPVKQKSENNAPTGTSSAASQPQGASTSAASETSTPESKADGMSKESKEKATPDLEGFEEIENITETQTPEPFEGLLMCANTARNPIDYLKFMAQYQKACNQSHTPVFKEIDENLKETVAQKNRKHRRAKRQEDELWKGIDQSLFLGPSGSVVWANVLIGRVLFSCLNDVVLHGKIQDFLQKKLSSVKLPTFMEDVVITKIHLGSTPPLIHRVSQPMLDERGTWLDADVTYEGLSYITVTTKLNLLRLKRPARPNPAAQDVTVVPTTATIGTSTTNMNLVQGEPMPTVIPVSTRNSQDEEQTLLIETPQNSAIFDSDAESSGGSTSEDESAPTENTAGPSNANEFNVFQSSPGNARRIFKIVDRITASNFFQYATDISYVQRAMENMSANITLRVDIKGLVSRCTINIPPPPSDRVWLAFRGPPRLWISAKPMLGDKSVDWSIVTNVIESKLCEEVNKYLVYPNMVDATIPFLGQPTYSKE